MGCKRKSCRRPKYGHRRHSRHKCKHCHCHDYHQGSRCCPDDHQCNNQHHNQKCSSYHQPWHQGQFACPPVVCLPPCPPVCDQRLRVNLAGLTGNLAFQFFRAKGCRVKIKYECSGGSNQVEGIICNVGNDNVSLRRDDGTVLSILIERICEVEWPDPECNPCVPCPTAS